VQGAAPTATTLSINFAAPYGSSVSAYVIQYRVTGQSAWTTYGTVTWVGWQTLSGLNPATSYDVQVYATYAGRNGPPSVPITLATTALSAGATVAPGAIPPLSAGAAATATSISVNFAAPYGGGTPAAYVIQYRVAGQTAWQTFGTVTWIGWQTLTGLVPATSYQVQVYATNSAGSGTPSPVFTAATASH